MTTRTHEGRTDQETAPATGWYLVDDRLFERFMTRPFRLPSSIDPVGLDDGSLLQVPRSGAIGSAADLL